MKFILKIPKPIIHKTRLYNELKYERGIKMKQLLRIVTIFSLATIMSVFFINDINTSASHQEFELAPLEGTQSQDILFNEAQIKNDFLQPFYSRKYLRDGDVSISGSGDTVTIRGTTASYSPVSKIFVKTTLERWDPSRGLWIPIYDQIHSNSNDTRVIGISRHTVRTGFYYRALARHWISQGTVVEEAYSQTSYIHLP